MLRIPGRDGLIARLLNWATMLVPVVLFCLACAFVEPVSAWLYDAIHGGALPFWDYFDSLR